MSDDLAFLPLDSLGSVAGDVARQALETNGIMLGQALGRPGGRFSPQWPAVKAMQFDWRLYIQKSERKRFLIFFKRPRQTDVVLDARVAFEIQATPARYPSLPSSFWRYRINLPPFLPGDLSAEEIRSLVKHPGGNAANSVVFALDRTKGRYLSVLNPSDEAPGLPRRVVFTGDGEQQIIHSPKNSTWLVDPVLDLLDAIAEWSRDPTANQRAVPLTIPPENELRDVVQIIRTLAMTYLEAAAALSDMPGALATRSLSAVGFHMALSRYVADVTLRINEDGTLALGKDDDPFQIAMRISPSLQPANAVFDLSFHVPDFLVEGPVRSMIADKVAEIVMGTRVLKELRRSPLAQALGVKAWSELVAPMDGFLSAARPGAIVLRTRRAAKKDDRHVDTDLIVFNASTRAGPAALIVQVELQVSPQARRATIDPEDVRVLFFGRRTNGERGLGKEILRYFFRLAGVFCRWNGVLS